MLENDHSNVLLMFSGGLDSAGALWNLLQDKANKLHIHHLHLLNMENRAEAEKCSVKNILDYVGKNYDFKYSESHHEYPTYSYLGVKNNMLVRNKSFMFDSDLYNFIAGTICISLPSIKKVAIGRTKSDDNYGVERRSIRGTRLLHLFAPTVEKIYPVGHLTKDEIYNMLPAELRNMSWSCRTPINIDKNTFKECGECKTCLELNKIKNQNGI
jgi:hypothetical protein